LAGDLGQCCDTLARVFPPIWRQDGEVGGVFAGNFQEGMGNALLPRFGAGEWVFGVRWGDG
jgi:hypothetical protein